MKKILIFSTLLLALASPAFATITLIAGPQCDGSTDGNNVTTTAINTTGANFIAVFKSLQAGQTEAPVDSKGNTLTALNFGDVGGGERGQWYYAENPGSVGASHTWSITSSNRPSLCVIAFSVVATASSFDQETGASTFATTLQPGSQTPAADNEVVLQGLSFNTAGAISIDESYTGLTQVNNDASFHRGIAVAYKIQTTATATNPTWTASLTSMVARSASFKAGSAGGSTRSLILGGGVF